MAGLFVVLTFVDVALTGWLLARVAAYEKVLGKYGRDLARLAKTDTNNIQD